MSKGRTHEQDRDLAAEVHVARLEHHPDAALAQLARNLVAAHTAGRAAGPPTGAAAASPPGASGSLVRGMLPRRRST